MNTELLKNNGVDLDKALDLFGDIEMYNDTLNDFLNTVDAKIDNLNKYLNENNMPSYAIDVHSLKSDARYLGFTSLGEFAYKLEMASKENDLAFVKENHQKLIELAKSFIDLSNRYLSSSEVEESITEETVNNDIKRILVVDDSNLVSEFVKKVFNGLYEVITADNGRDCINIINNDNTNSIKCLLLDINMPNVNGLEVLEYMKQNDLFKKLPVSIITGNDTKDAITEAFKYPIIDLINKPFSAEDVKRIVEKTIGFN